LYYNAYKNPAVRDGKFRIVQLNGKRPPCSFGNNIFINPDGYDRDTYIKILLHEKVHISQGHTLDIIIAELALIFQWFNPFAWLYKNELHNNLEFLTDDCVLGYHKIERASYQESLLRVSVPHLQIPLTANYSQSFLKKRILMMNAKKSDIGVMWKYLVLLPLLCAVMCAFNNTLAYGQAKKKAKEFGKGHAADTSVNTANADTTKRKMEDGVADKLIKTKPSISYMDTIIDGKEYKVAWQNGKITELHIKQAQLGNTTQDETGQVWHGVDVNQDSLNIIQEKKNVIQDSLNIIQDHKNLAQDTLNLLQDEKNLKQVALNKIQNAKNLRTGIGQNKINLQQDSLKLLQQEKNLRLLQEQNKNALAQHLLTLEQDKRNLQYDALQLGQDEKRYKTVAKN